MAQAMRFFLGVLLVSALTSSGEWILASSPFCRSMLACLIECFAASYSIVGICSGKKKDRGSFGTCPYQDLEQD